MRLLSIALIVWLASPVSAQTTSNADRFYDAIRRDDLNALTALVRELGVDTPDPQGQTPLMIASAFGSREAVRLLIEKGANVRAASGSGVTALHLAIIDLGKTRMLVEGGADVNAVSGMGRTPLLNAASAVGTADVIRLLLDKGARIDEAEPTTGVTPLLAAALGGDRAAAELLIARGANVGINATGLPLSTPLMAAATNGDAALVRKLLALKSEVNAVSADSSAKVKNGPVQFGRMTALHFAAVSRSPEVVKELLAAGATVDPLDVRGMTPLMFSIATDRPEPRIARLLLDAGANPKLSSKAGETAMDWAKKFNNPEVVSALKVSHVTAAVAPLKPSAAHTPRAAVERSLPLLQAASGRMMTDGGCVACHAQPLTATAINLARVRGWTTMSAADQRRQSMAQVDGALPTLLQLRAGGGLPDGLLYVAFQLAGDDAQSSRGTDAMVRYVAAKQQQDGQWEGVGGTRAPMQDGNFSRTALAIRALTVYATPAHAAEYRSRVERAAGWLKAEAPLSTEERVMQLLGLHWANAEPRTQQARLRELIALQRPDGGWAQTPFLASDAYATGQVLYTLRELGATPAETALQRGVEFLLRTQHDDGSWYVKNRAMKLQPYFEGGFPYEHDQWIAHAGTSWATIGLVVAAREPDTRTARNTGR